jgi:DNA-directed RNA polymerase subunit H
MSTNSNSHIISIYKARKNLLEILKHRGFDISPYENFSINEIGIMLETNQLDMLLEKISTKKKIYVKFYVSKVLKTQNIFDMVEDLFHLENILSKKDDFMIITKDEPNDNLNQNVKDIWMSDNIYISLLNIKRLQFNILNHDLVPPHTKLTETEKTEVKNKYNILNDNQIPDISYFSPVSLVMGFRPGDLIHIKRKSRTAIETDFYRICKM